MRDIKFRAWEKHLKKMLYLKGFTKDEHGVVVILPKEGGFWTLQATEVNLMQFTDLRDKNGKEIYEGDIVQDESIYRAPFWQYKIAWNDAKAGWLAFPLDDANYGFGLSIEGAKTLEVIGNIYENGGAK